MSLINNDILFTNICIFLSKTVPPPPPPSPLQLKLLAASVVSNHSVEAEHVEGYIGATLWQIDFSSTMARRHYPCPMEHTCEYTYMKTT